MTLVLEIQPLQASPVSVLSPSLFSACLPLDKSWCRFLSLWGQDRFKLSSHHTSENKLLFLDSFSESAEAVFSYF